MPKPPFGRLFVPQTFGIISFRYCTCGLAIPSPVGRTSSEITPCPTRITSSEPPPFCSIFIPRIFGIISFRYSCCTCDSANPSPFGRVRSEKEALSVTVALRISGFVFFIYCTTSVIKYTGEDAMKVDCGAWIRWLFSKIKKLS